MRGMRRPEKNGDIPCASLRRHYPDRFKGFFSVRKTDLQTPLAILGVKYSRPLASQLYMIIIIMFYVLLGGTGLISIRRD